VPLVHRAAAPPPSGGPGSAAPSAVQIGRGLNPITRARNGGSGDASPHPVLLSLP
jgi:hypothetical protein